MQYSASSRFQQNNACRPSFIDKMTPQIFAQSMSVSDMHFSIDGKDINDVQIDLSQTPMPGTIGFKMTYALKQPYGFEGLITPPNHPLIQGFDFSTLSIQGQWLQRDGKNRGNGHFRLSRLYFIDSDILIAMQLDGEQALSGGAITVPWQLLLTAKPERV